MSFINSAALIMLKSLKNVSKFSQNGDYSILFLKRVRHMKSFSGNIVFPGGMLDKTDLSDVWLDILGKHFSQDRLRTVSPVNSSSIYTASEQSSIPPHLAYRICAVRETFEETGVLVAVDNEGKNVTEETMKTIINEGWQNKLHHKSSSFMELCQMFNICPDVLSLMEWSLWITPENFKKRFRTIFYVYVSLSDVQIHSSAEEAQSVYWSTANQALDLYYKREGQLAPPQVIELILFDTQSLDQVIRLASLRHVHGVPIILPKVSILKDAQVLFLPGDTRYMTNDHKDLTLEDISQDPVVWRAMYDSEGQIRILNNIDQLLSK